MDLSSFLRVHDITTELLISRARSDLHLADSDVLLCVGSLAEGIGNARSDLDLILITDRSDVPLAYPGVAILSFGEVVVDVLVMNRPQVKGLIAKLDAYGAADLEPRFAGEFSGNEVRFLHRLHHSIALLQCGLDDVRWPSLVDIQFLARQRFQNALHEIKCLTIDLVGAREDADWSSMIVISTIILDHTVDALLSNFNLTNPTPKWRAKLLSMVPADWAANLPGRRTHVTAQELFFTLRRHPEHIDSVSTRDFCNRIASFGRSVTSWGSCIHSHGSADIALLPAFDANFGQALPALEPTVFILCDGKNFVGFNLIGEKGISLTSSEASLLLLFDGGLDGGGAFPVSAVRDRARRLGFDAGSAVDEFQLQKLLNP